MNVEYHASGDEVELAIRTVLMDSRSFCVKFAATTTPHERCVWFRRVNEIYQELGGGEVIATQNPTDPDHYLLQPRDDPDRNY